MTQPPEAFQVPTSIEYLAVLLWAVSGAIVGWRKGYDIVGVFVISFVSAFGGGLLRDGLFLQRLPVVLTDPVYYWLLAVAVAGVMLVGRRLQRDRTLPKVVSVIDALAVPMFVVIGAELARGRVRDLPAIVLVATVSGVGGGLLRDMLAGDTPELLRPGQFNTLLAVLAAALYLLLAYTLGYNSLWSAWIVIGLYFVTRLLIIRFNWRTRPLSEFEIRHVVEGVTGRLPGWKKGGEMRDSKPE